ncbi:2-amino-4-hydroxy-6-hydroxymethyldihydropteridine diphosphokinase [Echinimonas agarilytica]|uniref:2-amino-4-hydroxy-6-hydroxymethyldihydropteridine pyrophosphokinase n=1 Tax=Echinimonas agarilytica TaxID=1215918 RepID=A0AA42B6V6_9GAMM|nr:2-amino-4-hydroxy-6-hydroxymethyldihydropteridine diphosphokinase [Echinimonas agarilytica]MCM2678758.1 2-amino-4-hydroxy-6-hydroxymethyldihydropteridine diphosphokinase [Echinimonas agarilytica]
MTQRQTCYIGVGANLNHPVQQAQVAIDALKKLTNSRFIAASPLYCSKPLGPTDQPDYINAVVAIETAMDPEGLLNALQSIEQQQGRQRKDERWGPRTLDLDILLFGNQTIHTPRLTIPHYHMGEREFVLYPLADIAAELVLPDGTPLQTLLSQCPRNGLHQLEHSA